MLLLGIQLTLLFQILDKVNALVPAQTVCWLLGVRKEGEGGRQREREREREGGERGE